MTVPTAPSPARALTVVLAVLAALGLVKLTGRVVGFAVLLGVVGACVGALTIGILLLNAIVGI